MKKLFMVFVLACVVALSFSVSASAFAVVDVQVITESTQESELFTEGQGFEPFTEMVQVYWRNYFGQLQWRVWSITNGKWLTEWENL